jgi:hypothetical protein
VLHTTQSLHRVGHGRTASSLSTTVTKSTRSSSSTISLGDQLASMYELVCTPLQLTIYVYFLQYPPPPEVSAHVCEGWVLPSVKRFTSRRAREWVVKLIELLEPAHTSIRLAFVFAFAFRVTGDKKY